MKYRWSVGGIMLTSALGLLSMASAASSASGATVWLSELDLTKMNQGYARPQANRSVTEKPLSIGGKQFAHGVGTHAVSEFYVKLAGGAEWFHAEVGVDDAAGGPGTINFQIYGDGKMIFESGVMKPGDPPRPVDLDLKGIKLLALVVEDAGGGIFYDHADWADARFTVSEVRPKAIDGPKEKEIILTPKPGPAPRINGALVYGCRPGNPFIYRIPATGKRPMQFFAEDLPAGLILDPTSGTVTGEAPPRGEYDVTFRAKNRRGESTRSFKIVSGDTLALTPPMGWNDWYTHYDNITDALMREAADVMVSSGMADVGYQFVNIDDCWANSPASKDPLRAGPGRDSEGNILPNKHFPDMKALTAYIHSKGLKAGIYTSPGPKTCTRFEGSWKHEEADARQFADWGFDFLKYDWCSYGFVVGKDKSLAAMKKPYELMGSVLKKQNRDIVYNLCQYGMGNVWEWGAEVGGNCWRTAGDLGVELGRFFEVALKNAEHRQWSKPGAWNDPDYLQIGHTRPAADGKPQKFPLTPNQQYSFMSLWCLMASPLFFSGDMRQMDDFTRNILCNPEVIEIDQDPLGKCAEVITLGSTTLLMVKEMADGSKAVGLFNRGRFDAGVKLDWSDAGLSGPQTVRDLWRQKDLGVFDSRFETAVPRRDVLFLRLRATAR